MAGDPVKTLIQPVFERLDLVSLLSFALLALSVVFLASVVKPLETRKALLEAELSSAARSESTEGFTRVNARTPGARMTVFYRFFERKEGVYDWLAKLQGLARGAGLAWRSADYRLAESKDRLERYQIALPITGAYTQIRTFLQSVLTDIPVLSLDQVSFRRRTVNDGRVEADIVLSLYVLRK
jgi:hypothetical protein